MAQILVICQRVPWPLQDGHALRVFQLARHLDAAHTCHLACLPRGSEHVPGLQQERCFASITVLPPLPARRHWRRFLRRHGDRDYHRFAYPGYFAAAVATLQNFVDRNAINVVVATLSASEEFMRPLRGVAKILDQYDCSTLASERELAAATRQNLLWQLHRRHRLRQIRATESDLKHRCDAVTTIAPPDQQRLQELNPGGPPIELMPNGVQARLLQNDSNSVPALRGVAFWGDLGYSVNRRAVEYFYREVWLPCLQPAGVRWAIVGPNAGVALRDLAARHQEISLPGFVSDLFEYLAPYPVMINPMRTGSGLKNKVLEAMAAGKVVVSTSLGVDALPFLDGVHGRITDDPMRFAEIVLELLDEPARRSVLVTCARDLVRSRYTWEAVGSAWSELLTKVGGAQSRYGGGSGSCSGT